MTGVENLEMDHMTQTTPTWGQLVISRLILQMINWYRKFEVF